MPLSSTGWDPITFAEIRAGIVQLWKQAYGDNADTDPNTPDGLEISLIAMSLMLAFDVDTQLWANSFFRSATGVSLDRILDLFAKQRDPATFSTATTVFYGTPATPIPASTVVITADQSANRFATDAAGAIGADDNSDYWIVRILEAQDGVQYLAQVNAEVPSDYTALVSDDVEDIASGLAAEINLDGFATASLGGVDVDGNALIIVQIVGGPGNHTVFDVGAVGTVIDTTEATRVSVTALEIGPLPAVAGTLRTLANPIAGVQGVINDQDAQIGQSRESDDALKARHLQMLFANSARTDGGMQDSVAKINGIEENLVRSNRTVSPVDSFGRPIGSVENIILKTQQNPASDTSIANAIARQIPAGVEPYGLRSFGLGTTIDGEVIEVFATDVEELYLHLGVTITAGENFPTGDIETAVKTAISTYFNAGVIQSSSTTYTDVSAVLKIGKDWLRTTTLTPINLATNNAAALVSITSDVTANPGDPPTLTNVDQFADDRQIIRVDASRIAVTIQFV